MPLFAVSFNNGFRKNACMMYDIIQAFVLYMEKMDEEFRIHPEAGGYLAGKYRIIREIARGGMGIVFAAEDLVLNKKWAVKKIQSSSGRLPLEAEILLSLSHPSIVRAREAISTQNDVYIVMEYIPGVTLERYLKENGPLSERLVQRWAAELCGALKYLHTRTPAVIYKDMKPANIMVCFNEKLKLIDFGAAAFFESDAQNTGSSYGTRGYAPPEQYASAADERADIYSFGITLHRMLTGRDPSKGGAYIPARALRPDVSSRMADLIEKCVQKDPAQRYHSCREILRDLEHIKPVRK